MKTAKTEMPVRAIVPVRTEVKVREIPVEQLFVSLEENRKTIDQAALAEMARSIEKNGVIEALLVRPEALDQPDGEERYEIVAGQRRWLASKLAGKKTCPCIVCEMTDDEAREIRIVSNLQREDLPPMEEAEAYGKLLDRPGATIETVAAALARSPSYVGRRVQLLKAIEPVRQALRAGAVEVGHAMELARLDEARQRQMLTWMQVGVTLGECRFCGCTEDDACAGGCSWANEEQTICNNPTCLERFRAETGQQNEQWRPTHFSVVGLRSEIAKTSHVDLRNAPFALVAEIKPMACTECPKRAGNALLLFEDCAQDTCTDRSCYDRKVNLWIESELQAAKDEKRKLLKLTLNWTSDKDKVECDDFGPARAFKSPNECQHGEEGIWIDGRNIGHRATVCRKAECKTHHGRSSSGGSSRSSSSSSSGKAGPDPARTKLLAVVRAEKEYRSVLFKAIAAVPAQKISGQAFGQLLTRLACHAFDRSDSTKYPALAEAMGVSADFFGYSGKEKLVKHVATLPDQLKALFAAMAIEDSELTVHEHDIPAGAKSQRGSLDLEKIAEIVGVDWKTLLGKSQPVAAAPAKAAPPARAKPTAATAKKTVKAAPEKPASKKTAQKAVKKAVGKAVKKTAKKAAAKPVMKKAAKKGGGR